MASSAAGRSHGKLASIQLLRFIAALTVALVHQAFAFADHLGAGLGLIQPVGAGQVAVALFFVISGYIMVVSSRNLFGTAGARRVFWTRRAVRILPPYWIATLALLFILAVLLRQPADLRELGLSFALWPYWPADGSLRAYPYLWIGWTLFYELLFYAVFGLFVALPRRAAIGWTAATLLTLVALGLVVPPASAPLFTATRPVLLLFVGGMALALWRERGHGLPGWLRLAALAGAGVAVALLPLPDDPTAMGFDYLAWCGMPAVLLAVAVLGGDLTLPRPMLVNRLGDISYAL